jgi:hypothetical protein
MKDLQELANVISTQENLNRCTVMVVEGKLSTTSIIEISAPLADIVRKESGKILNSIQSHLPKCTNFGILPTRTGERHATCSTLSLTVDASHNSITEIMILCQMADRAHEVVLQALQRNLVLEAINKDMKPYE